VPRWESRFAVRQRSFSILSGLEHPTKGQVILNGKEINGASEDDLALFRRENVGFIFQLLNLIPTLSAWGECRSSPFSGEDVNEERKAAGDGASQSDGIGAPAGASAFSPFRRRKNSAWQLPGAFDKQTQDYLRRRSLRANLDSATGDAIYGHFEPPAYQGKGWLVFNGDARGGNSLRQPIGYSYARW